MYSLNTQLNFIKPNLSDYADMKDKKRETGSSEIWEWKRERKLNRENYFGGEKYL